MALHEDPSRRRQRRIETARYTGMQYVRVVTCPRGDGPTALSGSLARGSVLPAAWGGSSATTAWTARLQDVAISQTRDMANDELVLTYVAIDVNAGSNPYAPVANHLHIEHQARDVIYTRFGVCAATTDAGIPAVGSYLSGYGLDARDPVLASLRFDPSEAGRLITVETYRAAVAADTLS